ncbi:hypothetical protein DFJ73DRAFT_423625 [Zopfochytrium polystomum]|nr:hypothetical protein DFJ73DRAFT_423625 [Zopfochytrium polystomum]
MLFLPPGWLVCRVGWSETRTTTCSCVLHYIDAQMRSVWRARDATHFPVFEAHRLNWDPFRSSKRADLRRGPKMGDWTSAVDAFGRHPRRCV